MKCRSLALVALTCGLFQVEPSIVVAQEGRTRGWCQEIVHSVNGHDSHIAMLAEMAQRAPTDEAQKKCEPFLPNARVSQDQERKREFLRDYLECMRAAGSMKGGLVLASRESLEEEIAQRQESRKRLVVEFADLRCTDWGFTLPLPK